MWSIIPSSFFFLYGFKNHLANKIIFSAEVAIRIIQDVLKTTHVYVYIL